MLYVIRHGKTDWNLENKIQGRADIPLNHLGIQEANLIKEALNQTKFYEIISSPLIRAKKTAEIIGEERNIEVEVDERLKEISFGINEGNKFGSYDYHGFWNYHEPHLYPEAEDVRDFVKRVSNFLDSLKGVDAENILLVAHGGVSKAVAVYFNGVPEDGQLEKLTRLENCDFLKFNLD